MISFEPLNEGNATNCASFVTFLLISYHVIVFICIIFVGKLRNLRFNQWLRLRNICLIRLSDGLSRDTHPRKSYDQALMDGIKQAIALLS